MTWMPGGGPEAQRDWGVVGSQRVDVYLPVSRVRAHVCDTRWPS